MTDPTANDVPQDAKLVAMILRSMDVADYEDRVIPQLLDFSYRPSSFFSVFEDHVACGTKGKNSYGWK